MNESPTPATPASKPKRKSKSTTPRAPQVIDPEIAKIKAETAAKVPAIRAFAEQRKHDLQTLVSRFGADALIEARIDELQMIIALIDGLTQQNELLAKAMNKGTVEA